jgi:very-short-patch-repair endonuclease
VSLHSLHFCCETLSGTPFAKDFSRINLLQKPSLAKSKLLRNLPHAKRRLLQKPPLRKRGLGELKTQMNPLYNQNNLKERRQLLRRKATFSEKILWQDLRKRKMKGLKFYRQFSIGGFIYDFYCPQIHLAIELDGISHEDPGVLENDRMKNQFLERNGISILRFRDEEVLKDYEGVLKRIETRITGI